jgi:hypothetical protein
VPIYNGPGSEFTEIGALAVGTPVRVLGDMQQDWIPVECPAGGADSCWVLWDYNALYPHEGSPLTLSIPDPASLKTEYTNTTPSPDGRWQAQMTHSETVALAGEWEASFFYVELKVVSLADGTTWTPVSEWHAAGLGQEYAPQPFYWSKDGRFLYYTSSFDHHAACVVYDNIGDYLNRLDLSDGSVATLRPPQARGILALSSDETLMAYLSDQKLIVREMAAAYDEADASQDSVKWQIPLQVAWPAQVSRIAWSPDNRQVLVTVTEIGDNCQLASRSTWELDVETGAFTAAPIVCPQPEAASSAARETFLIFCGGPDHVNVAYNGSLIIDGALTAEAYVNYFGSDEAGQIIEIVDVFNISYAGNEVSFCLFAQGTADQQAGWRCLSYPQPERNRWVHLAGSWDGETMYLFVDGALKAEMPFAGPLSRGGPDLKLGNSWMLFDGFNGFIDEVRFSSISRYDADFEPQSQFTADEFTVGLWHFDEGQGTATADESSNENDGILSSFVRWGSQP